MNTDHAKRVVDFQEIRRVPLTAVLDHLGELARLKRVGSSLVGGCPICGGTSRRKFTRELQEDAAALALLRSGAQ